MQREYIYLPAADSDYGNGVSLPLAHLNNTLNGNSTNEMLLILNDHLRTPTKLTNSVKAIVWDRTQTPFSENATLAGTKETNLRLPGQYYDLESGYHYNLMRDYDAKTGRYLQSDPIGLVGGINRFGYVAGNPVNFTDSKGTNAIATGILGAAELCAMSPGCSGAVAAGMIYMFGNNNSSHKQDTVCKEPIPEDQFKECEKILDIDTQTCKGITRARGKVSGAKCHQSAMERYAACLTNKPLPPLNVYNN